MFSKIKLYLVYGFVGLLAIGMLIYSLTPRQNTDIKAPTLQKQLDRYDTLGNFARTTDILKTADLKNEAPKDLRFGYSINIEDYLLVKNSQVSYYKIPNNVKERVLAEAKIQYKLDGPDNENVVVKKTIDKGFEIVNSQNTDLFVYKDKIYKMSHSYVDMEGFVQGYKTFVLMDENGENKKAVSHLFGDKILKLQVIGDFVYMTTQNFDGGIVVLKIEIATGDKKTVLNSESGVLNVFKNLDSSLDFDTRNLKIGIPKEESFVQAHYALDSDVLLHTSYYKDRFYFVKQGGGDLDQPVLTYKEIVATNDRSGMTCKRDDCIIVSKDKILKVNITRGEVATKNLDREIILPSLGFDKVPNSSWLRWVGEPEIFQNGKWQKLEL